MTNKYLPEQKANNLREVYKQLCGSYRAIDEFRTKLLGFLPLATGAGIFLLLADKKVMSSSQDYLWAIGAFGFIVTLGLFCFELHGIKKCTHLLKHGEKLEESLGTGQFTNRPRGFAGFINEPFASGIIYPAVLAVWTYIALVFPPPIKYSGIFSTSLAQDGAICVFSIGFVFTFLYDLRLILDKKIKKILVCLKNYIMVQANR